MIAPPRMAAGIILLHAALYQRQLSLHPAAALLLLQSIPVVQVYNSAISMRHIV